MKFISKIKVHTLGSIFISYFQHKRFLLIKKEFLFVNFLIIPFSIKNLVLKNKELTLFGSNTTESLNFLNTLTLLKNSCVLKKKIISLKGLGLKINYSISTKSLNFKLGYSHLLFIQIPPGVDLVKIGKNYIILSSFDLSLLGNFLSKVQHLRFPDAYKGKGFWKKYEKRKLKLFKKK